jgi:H+/Na+-translocating ferredoxin:NAD+ oxidoreductase subunit B
MSHLKLGYRFENEWPQENLDEALHILEISHQAGLVHMAYGHGDLFKPGVVNSICSCCTYCCGIFSGIFRFGMFPYLLTSHSIAETDPGACIDCGKCVDRCQFKAREMVDNHFTFHQEMCFGCGVCLNSCPTQAIQLIEKPEQG